MEVIIDGNELVFSENEIIEIIRDISSMRYTTQSEIKAHIKNYIKGNRITSDTKRIPHAYEGEGFDD